MSSPSVDFMNARQLEEILQVNRTTIYRMAERGSVPAFKVGGQWRFPRRQIEEWLQQNTEQAGPVTASAPRNTTALNLRRVLPLACVQLIQDTFAHVLGLSLRLADMEGNSVTEPSNVCPLHRFFAEGDATFGDRQQAAYAMLAKGPGVQPVYMPDAVGLLCARALVSLQGENVAMVIAEGIAPAVWPPQPDKMAQLAAAAGVEVDDLRAQLDGVYRADAYSQAKTLDSIQRIADIVAHVMQERNQFQTTLQNIAELARIQ